MVGLEGWNYKLYRYKNKKLVLLQNVEDVFPVYPRAAYRIVTAPSGAKASTATTLHPKYPSKSPPPKLISSLRRTTSQERSAHGLYQSDCMHPCPILQSRRAEDAHRYCRRRASFVNSSNRLGGCRKKTGRD